MIIQYVLADTESNDNSKIRSSSDVRRSPTSFSHCWRRKDARFTGQRIRVTGATFTHMMEAAKRFRRLEMNRQFVAWMLRCSGRCVL